MSSAEGIDSARDDGSSVAIARSTTVVGTPLAMNASAYCIIDGTIKMNVKTSSAMTSGSRTSRMT